jgi:hypothetical protein
MKNQVTLPEFIEDELMMLSTDELKAYAKVFLDEVKRRKNVKRNLPKN